MAMRVSAINVHPIKSAKAIAVQEAVLTDTGFRWDREWMVVKADNGKFLTARRMPKLLLVQPAIPSEAFKSNSWQAQPGDIMRVDAPGMPTLHVPLIAPACEESNTRTVTVWEWTGRAHDEGDEAAQWFSKYLGVACRLVRYLGGCNLGEDVRRAAADQAYAAGYQATFSNGSPYLLATEASLQALASKLGQPDLPMSRFRPNVVVSGAEAWQEDLWSGVVLGEDPGVEFAASKPCERCKMTTVDPVTMQEGDEPLATMGTFRSGQQLGLSALNKSWTHSVFFGLYLVTSRSGCTIHVGDVVRPRLCADVGEAAAAAKVLREACLAA